MNSSSNNSKFKNIDELKARIAAKSSGSGGFGGGVSSGGGFGGGFGAKIPKRQQQQVIIEEIEDDPKQRRLFDYNLNQVDKSLLPPKDYAKPVMVGVVLVVSLFFGAFIGSCWQYVFAQRAEVNLRIDVAKNIEPTIKQKVDNFQTFSQLFRQRSESLGAGVLEYNENFYNDVIKKYNSPATFAVMARARRCSPLCSSPTSTTPIKTPKKFDKSSARALPPIAISSTPSKSMPPTSSR